MKRIIGLALAALLFAAAGFAAEAGATDQPGAPAPAAQSNFAPAAQPGSTTQTNSAAQLNTAAQPAAAAAPEAPARNVTLGDTALSLPPLAGFRQIYGNNAAFDGMIDQFVAPGKRMLAVYGSEADIPAMTADPKNGLHKYILVQTALNDEPLRDPADFAEIKDGIARELGDGALQGTQQASDAVGKAEQYMHSQLGKDMTIKIGETKILGRFLERDDVVCYSLLTNSGVTTAAGTKDYPLATAMAAVAVKGHVLYLFAYSDYKDARDVDFVVANTRKYLDALFAANGGEPAPKAAPDAGDLAGTAMSWATWAAVLVALAAGAALLGLRLLKQPPGDKDERL